MTTIRFNETDASSKDKQPEEQPQNAYKRKERRTFSWKTLGISAVIAGVYFGFVYYLRQLKEEEWERDRVRTLGKAAIGGSFELMDVNRKIITNEDFKGKWILIYFGFTHCPGDNNDISLHIHIAHLFDNAIDFN